MINLPVLLFKLVRYNFAILQSENNDLIVGFFPFNNADALPWMYVVVLLKDFYAIFVQNKFRYLLLFMFEFLLLLSSLNFKFFTIVVVCVSIVVVTRLKDKMRAVISLSLLSIYPVTLLLPLFHNYSNNLKNAPVYVTTQLIVDGVVKEYSMLFGTGPGTFTSPIAFETNSKITFQYGLTEMARYWSSYGGPTGLLTRSTSSFLTLLGDVGYVVLFLYFIFILRLLIYNYRYVQKSHIAMIGFSMGLYAMVVGLFMDTWFWGIELFILMLATKYISDVRTIRNQVR